jgi:putative DNA methylase
MARAQNVSVPNLAQTGILEHGRGKVRLFSPAEYSLDWDPQLDVTVPVWEALHQLARAWDDGGESAAAELVGRLEQKADSVPDLARRMFALAEKRGLTSDAVTFNAIVAAWPRLRQLATATSNRGQANQQIGMEV